MATERSVRMVLHKLAVVRWDRLVEGERLARLRVDDKWPRSRSAIGTVRCPGKAVVLCAGRARAAPAQVEERDTHLERVVRAVRTPALWRPCQRQSEEESQLLSRCLPTAQASIMVDWSQWVDEAEEEEARRAPLGHDVSHMRGAMGGSFGSNIERDLAAKKQAQRLDTSKEDDEDEEITLC